MMNYKFVFMSYIFKYLYWRKRFTVTEMNRK